MNSPNLMAAAAAQRTKKLKLLIYGNLLPLHQPLRLAEELAMLDCLSNGRIISGFARGIPREYQVHNVPLRSSRARYEEAYEIVTRAWSEEIFSYEGVLVLQGCRDLAAPGAEARTEIWIPIVGSKESIEFAGKKNAVITPGLARGGLQEDIIRYFAKCLAANGHKITPNHLSIAMSAYVADSKAGRCANSRLTIFTSTVRYSVTATSRKPPSSAMQATSPRRPTIMCARKTRRAARPA